MAIPDINGIVTANYDATGKVSVVDTTLDGGAPLGSKLLKLLSHVDVQSYYDGNQSISASDSAFHAVYTFDAIEGYSIIYASPSFDISADYVGLGSVI